MFYFFGFSHCAAYFTLSSSSYLRHAMPLLRRLHADFRHDAALISTPLMLPCRRRADTLLPC